DRAPPVDHPGHGQDPRPAQGPPAGNGHAPGTPGPARPLLQALSTPVQGSGGHEGHEGCEGNEGAFEYAEFELTAVSAARDSCCFARSPIVKPANSLRFPVVTGLASSIRMLIDDGTDGLTKEAIGIAIAIHRKYGPKLLENAYLRPYVIDLRAAGHTVDCQPRLALVHAGVTIQNAYRPDIIVD